MADSELRQRKPLPGQGEVEEEEEELFEKPKPGAKPIKISKYTVTGEEEDDPSSPWLDGLRVLTFLALVFCVSSYVISGGESWFWGMKDKPDYVKLSYWKEKIQGPVCSFIHICFTHTYHFLATTTLLHP